MNATSSLVQTLFLGGAASVFLRVFRRLIFFNHLKMTGQDELLCELVLDGRHASFQGTRPVVCTIGLLRLKQKAG